RGSAKPLSGITMRAPVGPLSACKEEWSMQMEKKWVRRLLVTNGIVLAVVAAPLVYAVTATEAPAGFDNLTNGFESQAQFDLDKANFDEREEIADGLGPVYNAQACAECHQNPVSGATSQITELRKGRFDGVTFTDPPGGSLNNDRAINAAIQERVLGADNVTASSRRCPTASSPTPGTPSRPA